MKTKINIKRILENSFHKIPPNAKINAGEKTMKVYLKMMKQWTEEEVDEVFDDNMSERQSFSQLSRSRLRKMRRLRVDDPEKRPFIVFMTRRHVRRALKRICKQIKYDIRNEIEDSMNVNKQIITVDSKIDFLPEPTCQFRSLNPSKIAKKMISKEGILNKFADYKIIIKSEGNCRLIINQ